MKRSAFLLLAISLVLPAMASAQMSGRSGGMRTGNSSPPRAVPSAPAFRGSPMMPRGVPPAFGTNFRSGGFTRGRDFPHTIGTPAPGVFGHPIGTNPAVFEFGIDGFRNHHGHHHRINGGFVYPFAYYPGYYYSPFGWDYYNYSQPDPNYERAPNVVYVPVPESSSEGQAQQQASVAPPPQSESLARDAAPENVQPTVLVFRDGHTREVLNYAIQGETLYVLSGKNARIALADIDVPATIKANDDRGVVFRVPPQQ